MSASRRTKNKKAISELISYVLLITLALAMATATYFFMKAYAEKPLPEENCPEGTSVVVENYSCSDGYINITIRNRGLHSIVGVYIKGGTEAGSELWQDLWELSSRANCDIGQKCTPCGVGVIGPREECSAENVYYAYLLQAPLRRIVIIPYRAEKGYTVICKNAISSLDVQEGECPLPS